ncbi:uncharacterized protein LY89DRAFT_789827 [Mollisia scopiformis]|uniref:Uncharacterized protein n=1 Tax=Mollisia scopiformis TaxID=149040 RepID=A0A132B4Q7_MOLSC|nr:uncharacterized protein LY89DRAFT_789827 [Mollisia scopiformis]KUJ07386.1 hypothetical protein LY89DRAFT_789827 [Mollisia scopiformis]
MTLPEPPSANVCEEDPKQLLDCRLTYLDQNLTSLLPVISDHVVFAQDHYHHKFLCWLTCLSNAVKQFQKIGLEPLTDTGLDYGQRVVEYIVFVLRAFLSTQLCSPKTYELSKAVSEIIDLVQSHPRDFFDPCYDEFMRGREIWRAGEGLLLLVAVLLWDSDSSSERQKIALEEAVKYRAGRQLKHAAEVSIANAYHYKGESDSISDRDSASDTTAYDSDTQEPPPSILTENKDTSTAPDNLDTSMTQPEAKKIENKGELPKPPCCQLPSSFTFNDLTNRVSWPRSLPSSYPPVDNLTLNKDNVTQALTSYTAFHITLPPAVTYRKADVSDQEVHQLSTGGWWGFFKQNPTTVRARLKSHECKYVDELQAAIERFEPWPETFDLKLAGVGRECKGELKVIFVRTLKSGLDITSAYKQAMSAPQQQHRFPLHCRSGPPPPPPLPARVTRLWPSNHPKIELYTEEYHNIALPHDVKIKDQAADRLSKYWLKARGT